VSLTDLSPDLAALVARLMAALPGDGRPAVPPVRPRPGQSHDDWLGEVRVARAINDDPARVLAVRLTPPGPPVAAVRDHTIPVDGGTITARAYTPEGAGPFPAVVFYHGGAFWLAGGEAGFALTDDYLRLFCDGLGAVVINVDYRLAPEHPFPQQLEDSYAGLCWAAGSAPELNIDPGNVAVMGASSGGNQAAAVCLLSRDRGGPRIRAQILHVPALDLTGGSPSLHEDPAIWDHLNDVIALYATPEQRADPLASPLLARDLTGLPPAVIVTGQHDPLRDDGRRYAERLAMAGVPATLLDYPMLHNIALPRTSQQMFAEMITAISGLLDGAVS
jgi:acetyl esterase/lipase